MEEQYFLANLAFGNSPALKMVIARDRKDAIQTVYDNYHHANILGMISLDELDEITKAVDEGKAYFVTEMHKAGDEVIMKPVIERGTSFEQLKIKYENRDAIIMDCNQMREIVFDIYRWLESEGQHQSPLHSARLS